MWEVKEQETLSQPPFKEAYGIIKRSMLLLERRDNVSDGSRHMFGLKNELTVY